MKFQLQVNITKLYLKKKKVNHLLENLISELRAMIITFSQLEAQASGLNYYL